MMVQYRMIYPITNGLFARVFNALYPDEFKTIFGNTTVIMCDALALLLAGDRYMMVDSGTDNDQQVAAIISLNLPEWLRIVDIMNKDYEVLSQVQYVKQSNSNSTVTDGADRISTDADMAFNDTAFTDSTQNTRTDNRTRTDNTGSNETIRGLGNRSAADEIRKEWELRRSGWIYDIIYKIVKSITLDIY